MFFERTVDGYVLRIRVSPNASKCATKGIFLDANGAQFLKVALVAQPEKGKANQELIKFLSKWIGVSKSCFTIISGETDRYKKISLQVSHDVQLEQIFYQMEQSDDSGVSD